MIFLKEINEENFEDVIKLRVSQNDNKFVASNVRSLADCWLYRNNNDCFPFAIYAEDILVGFLLISIDKEEKEYYIWRIMIDEKYQNKGYAQQVLKLILEEVNKDSSIEYILTDYVVGNNKMKYILEKLNFEYYKYHKEWNQIAMKYYKNKEVINDNN